MLVLIGEPIGRGNEVPVKPDIVLIPADLQFELGHFIPLVTVLRIDIARLDCVGDLHRVLPDSLAERLLVAAEYRGRLDASEELGSLGNRCSYLRLGDLLVVRRELTAETELSLIVKHLLLRQSVCLIMRSKCLLLLPERLFPLLFRLQGVPADQLLPRLEDEVVDVTLLLLDLAGRVEAGVKLFLNSILQLRVQFERLADGDDLLQLLNRGVLVVCHLAGRHLAHLASKFCYAGR